MPLPDSLCRHSIRLCLHMSCCVCPQSVYPVPLQAARQELLRFFHSIPPILIERFYPWLIVCILLSGSRCCTTWTMFSKTFCATVFSDHLPFPQPVAESPVSILRFPVLLCIFLVHIPNWIPTLNALSCLDSEWNLNFLPPAVFPDLFVC